MKSGWTITNRDIAGQANTWDLHRPNGTSAASIWANTGGKFTWHTWDQSGAGGENSVENTLDEAYQEATVSAITQGFYEAQWIK